MLRSFQKLGLCKFIDLLKIWQYNKYLNNLQNSVVHQKEIPWFIDHFAKKK